MTLDSNGTGSLFDEPSKNILNRMNNDEEAVHDVAVIMYTSGTTGKPKGAMLTHECLYYNAEKLIQIWNIKSNDTIMHSLPLFHVHGLFFAIHTVFLAGSSIILLPKFDPECFFEYLTTSTIFYGRSNILHKTA